MTIELLGDDCMSMVIGFLHDPVSVCSLMATSQRLASLVRSNEASEALLRSSWLTRLQDLRVLEGGVGVGDEGGGEGLGLGLAQAVGAGPGGRCIRQAGSGRRAPQVRAPPRR
jgi:hypothetical protein